MYVYAIHIHLFDKRANVQPQPALPVLEDEHASSSASGRGACRLAYIFVAFTRLGSPFAHIISIVSRRRPHACRVVSTMCTFLLVVARIWMPSQVRSVRVNKLLLVKSKCQTHCPMACTRFPFSQS